MRRGLQVYDHVGEGRGKDVRKPAEEGIREAAEEAHTVEGATGVTVGSLRRFRAAFIGPT